MPQVFRSAGTPVLETGGGSKVTNRGIAVVGIRLLAVYLLLQLLLLVPDAVERWTDATRPAAPVVLTMLAGLVAAAFLWTGTGRVASWMLPARTARSLAEEQAGQTAADRGLVAFSAAGALLIAWTLPELLSAALTYYTAGPINRDETLLPLLVAALRLALGFGMMLGSAGLARAVHHLRRTGAG